MPKIYLSGALMGAANLQAARAKYEQIAKLLEAREVSVYLPHNHTDPSTHFQGQHEVYQRDTAEMYSRDAVVAVLDEPSLGVGAELALCVERSIPIIGLLHEEKQCSRFILGMLAASPRAVVLRYSNIEITADAIVSHLSKLLS